MAAAAAFSGGNMSEDASVTSMAILTAAYAVRQLVSPPWPVAPSLDKGRISLDERLVSLKAELMERAIAFDVAASVLGSFRFTSLRSRPP